jgi:hypothetical protein
LLGSKSFELYGGRGISVCMRWRLSFHAFSQDMGPRPSQKHQIDRMDNDGNYEPSNCRWATPIENQNNKRRSVRVTFQGRLLTVKQWAYELGVTGNTAWGRYYKLKRQESLATQKP